MENDFNKVIEKMRTVVLSETDKKNIWQRVGAHIKTHPVVEKKQTMFTYFGVFFDHRIAVEALIAVLVLGGGTSLAAQMALPNNFLYPIKININEEVLSWFALGAKKKAYLEIQRVGNRLEEVAALAQKGELTDKVKERVSKNLQAHVDAVQRQITAVGEKSDLESVLYISQNLENSLEQHRDAIIKIDRTIKEKDALVAVENPALPSSARVTTAPQDTATAALKKAPVQHAKMSTTTAVKTLQKAAADLTDIVQTIQRNIETTEQTRDRALQQTRPSSRGGGGGRR